MFMFAAAARPSSQRARSAVARGWKTSDGIQLEPFAKTSTPFTRK